MLRWAHCVTICIPFPKLRTPSRSGIGCIEETNSVIIMPANALAKISARPSGGSVFLTKRDFCFEVCTDISLIPNTRSLSQSGKRWHIVSDLGQDIDCLTSTNARFRQYIAHRCRDTDSFIQELESGSQRTTVWRSNTIHVFPIGYISAIW